jgi:hypothetical protein
MSVDGIEIGGASAVTGRSSATSGAFDRLAVGEELTLTVLRRLGVREYLVSIGNERHVVESVVDLAVGVQVRAGVTAVGERLTLRYIEADKARTDDEPQEGDVIGQLAARHGVTLAAGERAQLHAAAADATDPARLILSGLYLTKLGFPVEQQLVQALYTAQTQGAAGRAALRGTVVADAGRALQSEDVPDSPEQLERLVGDAFDAAAPARSDLGSAGGDSRGDDDESEREELVRRALNSQDGGSIGYRYATLPLLIGGDLTELQVALFTPRYDDARGRRVRRLVMTLDTPRLREIRIETKSVDERIVVAIDASTPEAVEALAAREREVREMLARLGWAVEAVSYGVNVPPDRAARRIVDHVLAAGTVDEAY